MKFNEKLIKLRKEAGLSQEELGYKLNVTRQTVSKWELGETTPEMSKLIEIANCFEVTVDDLTNDDEEINSKERKNNNSNNGVKIVKIIAIAAIVILIIYFIFVGIIFKLVKDSANSQVGLMGGLIKEFFNGINKQSEESEKQQNKFIELYEKRDEEIKEFSGGVFDSVVDVMKQTQGEYDRNIIEMNKRSFNLNFELGVGTKSNTVVQSLIDKVITSNQKNERKITIKYNDKIISDVNEMRKIKRDFDDISDKFEIYLEYDNEGFVNQVVIEKI